jgi:hypothetical protein
LQLRSFWQCLLVFASLLYNNIWGGACFLKCKIRGVSHGFYISDNVLASVKLLYYKYRNKNIIPILQSEKYKGYIHPLRESNVCVMSEIDSARTHSYLESNSYLLPVYMYMYVYARNKIHLSRPMRKGPLSVLTS